MSKGRKPNPSRSSLASELLIEWMVRKKITQRRLAARLDWPLTRVTRMLNGQHELTVSEAIAIEDLTQGEVFTRFWTRPPTNQNLWSTQHESIGAEAH